MTRAWGSLIVIGLVVALGAACGGGEGDYTERNLTILDELPTPEGFERGDVEHVANPDAEANGGEADAVTTIASFTPTSDPAPTAPTAFYSDNLEPEWTAQEAVLNRGTISVQFCRDAAGVQLNLGDPSPDAGGGYQLAIDHDSAACRE